MAEANVQVSKNSSLLDELEVGYFELLRKNPTYTRFWLSFLISNGGTWFNTIAVFVLVIEITGSELALGGIMALRMLAFSLPQPFTGMLADMYSRKKIMIIANLISALVALGLIFANNTENLILIYIFVILLMALHALEVPASRAALPNIVKENELLTANAIDTATWSAMLGLGCALGGFVTAKYGVNIAFIVDAISFVIAALFIYSIKIPQNNQEKEKGSIIKNGIKNIFYGWKYISGKKEVLRLVFAKSIWTIGGGGLVFLIVLVGDNIGFDDFAIGVGVMFLARAIGVGVGPLVSRSLFKDREKWKYLIGLLISVSGIFYFIFGLLEWTMLSISLIIFSHAASGSNWVLSNVMLQERVPDEWRGRVFGTDLWLMALFNSASAFLASIFVDQNYLSLRDAILVFAMLQIIIGLLFSFWMVRGFDEDVSKSIN
ncbi:MAG: MFS transporter [Euryarchaeota archaeon]|nr:MFS transporter [Euryarchaeota archaeon]|tara:strand:- start:137 stop:1438 length:1302 start_codon:yes stop_codon:yes gene_type:complete